MKKILFKLLLITYSCLFGCAKTSTTKSVVPTSSENYFPTINFTLPSNIFSTNANSQNSGSSNLFLTNSIQTYSSLDPMPLMHSPLELSILSTTSASDNVLNEWSIKIDKVVQYTNMVMDKLNLAKIKSGIRLSLILSNGNKITITTGTVSGSTDYSQQAVICSNDMPYVFLQWNNTHSNIHAIRDFGVNPHLDSEATPTAMMGELIYSVDSNSQTIVDFYLMGIPWTKPTDITDGDYLIDHIQGIKTKAGALSLTGVNSWQTALPTTSFNGSGQGKVWLAGQLGTDGLGSFVIHRKYNSAACPNSFDQGIFNWCILGTVTSLGTNFAIDSTSILAAWNNLSSLRVTNDSSLKFIQFPTGLTCQKFP